MDNLKINSFSKGRKKPLIYIQPESSNFNYKHRNNDFKRRDIFNHNLRTKFYSGNNEFFNFFSKKDFANKC